MKATLVLGINVMLSVATVTTAHQCQSMCADVKKGVSFKSGCSAFRNSLPRPKVSSKCQSGFKAAVDMNCYDACVNGGRLQPFLSERRLDEACKSALKETPRPLCHDACVRGYRSGIKDMSASLVKLMAEAAPAVLAALKDNTAMTRKIAKTTHAVAGADSTTVEEPAEEPVGFAEAGVAASSQRVDSGSFGRDIPYSEGKKDVAEDATAASQKQKEVQGVDRTAGEHKEARGIDEQRPVSVGDTQEVEDDAGVAPDDGMKAQLEEVDHEDEVDQDEDIYTWIEDEDKVLLSLPITVDNVQKELAIFEGDEPLDVVLAFCRDNMPEEGAACVDELIRVVQDKIFPGVPPQEE